MTLFLSKKIFKEYRSKNDKRLKELEDKIKEMSKDIKALKSKLHVIEIKDECG
jgi:hypothetical protein